MNIYKTAIFLFFEQMDVLENPSGVSSKTRPFLLASIVLINLLKLLFQ